MKRFILKEEPDSNGLVRLGGEDFHYLVRVRRLAAGECFPALLPSGKETLVRIRSVEAGFLSGECTAEETSVSGTAASETVGSTAAGMGLPPVILFQALPKGEKMDLIVRQAAEGGITEIVPFISAWSIPKIKERAHTGNRDSKAARWERIVKEARQQSGSRIATVVKPLLSIDGLFVYWEELKQQRPPVLGLLFHHVRLQGEASLRGEVSLHSYLEGVCGPVALAIGPEGGFSPDEADRFLDAGFKAVTIGDTVLRTETAALYGAAAIKIILLERNSWEMKLRPTGNE